MKKVAVLGAGSWGTALSIVLADNGHEVRLWSHRAEQVDEINMSHTNEKYLTNIELPQNIVGYENIEKAVSGVDLVLLVVPTSAIREVCSNIKDVLDPNTVFVHASKGIEPDSLQRISEIIEDEIPACSQEEIVILAGPSHAEEVALRQPTTVTVASRNEKHAQFAQHLFINDNFRVYTSDDIVGVELGGALKNIIALGAGLSDGLGFGDNAKAALITRGLAEISRLGTEMGANPLTFLGLCGVGDLIVTSTSTHSRNWRAGNMLGAGNSLSYVLDNMGMVVEGIRTTKAAYRLSKQEEVDMPITKGLYAILFNDANPKDVVEKLMSRDRRKELDE